MFFTNMILYDLCVFATLRAKFHAKAQRRKVYCHYLDCWYELRTVIFKIMTDISNNAELQQSCITAVELNLR